MRFFWGTIYIFLIFVNTIETRIHLFSYWDEVFTCLILIYGCSRFLRQKRYCIKKSKFRLWFYLALLIIIGLFGNFIHFEYQNNISVIIRDIVALCKFFVILFIFEDIGRTNEKQVEIIHLVSKISKIILIITLICAGVGWIQNNSFYTGEVRSVKCFRFVFSHPTFFVSSYVMIMAILMADSIKNNSVYIYIDCILLFLAQRTKGMIVVVVALIVPIIGEKRLIYMYDKAINVVNKKKINSKKYIAILLLISVAWLLMKDKVELYFSWGLSAARPALYIVGVEIMLKYFPFGSGFGTFASSLSARYYSPIYDEYHISGVSGITISNYNYIGDVFWPYIYGQLGLFGLLLYLCLIRHCITSQIKSNDIVLRKFAIIIVWIYALMASTAEAFFTNSSGVQMALILGIFIGNSKEISKK